MEKLKLEQKIIGMVSTNVYLAVNTQTREAFLVDPADNADLIADWIKERGVTVKAILLTHGHFDHIGAVTELKRTLQAPVYALEAEKTLLADPRLNASVSYIRTLSVEADVWLRDGQNLELAGFEITVMHTPGHTKGGACYYLPREGVLFSGDTVFCESIGRADLPTGNGAELVRSVRKLLAALPDETTVYPGHDEATSVAHEKMYNPFI